MKINRTKNASRNMIFGWIQNVYSLIVPFITRTVIIYVLGIQYLGLNSLFSSVLAVLNMAELGVGFAMTYSMYKPIAEDDTRKICALMKLYKIYYRIIGLVIAILGLILLPFISELVNGDVPSGVNVYILYLLNLGTTVFSYWLFSYKNCLLSAHQRNDVSSKVSLGITTFTNVGQILVVVLFENYYLYLVVALIMQLCNNIITAIIVSKMYPQYKAEGCLEKQEVKEINKKVADLFTSKIGAVVVDSADTIVISAFLGLTSLAIYQNYFYIMTSVRRFITVIFSSCTAGIGNSIVLENKEKNFCDLNLFMFIICWLAGLCSCSFLCLYQPFMKLWVGENFMLDIHAVVCIVIYFYIMEINQLLNLYKDAAGLWHKDKWRPLCSAMTNLVLNLVMVQLWGLYGILLSTIIAITIVEMPWLLHNLFTQLFYKNNLVVLLRKVIMYTGVVLMSCVMCYMLCNIFELSDWATLIVRATICIVVPNIIYFVVYRRTDEFNNALGLVNKITRCRIPGIRKLG